MAAGNKKIANNLFIASLCILFISACNEPAVYAVMHPVEEDGWDSQQAVCLEIPVKDSLSLYHIDITGRLKYSYFPNSLSLIIQVKAPSGASFCDTISFAITHVRDRIWEEFRFPYCSHIRFSETGNWQMNIRQNMNVETLMGVSAIGLYLQKE